MLKKAGSKGPTRQSWPARYGRLIIASAVATLGVGCDLEPDTPTTPGLVPEIHYLVSSSNKLYTLDADFDEGILVNVNHDAPNNNQLQLNAGGGTFPFIWVGLSVRCTVAKISTATGAIVGEYRTIADGAQCFQSSRTNVDVDGSLWLGHRGLGGVTHIGLSELNQCIDRNGNGTIETSTGYGDVLPWAGGSPSPVSAAADECILHHLDTDALGFGDTRHISLDGSGHLWIGTYATSPHRFVRANTATGALELGTLRSDLACGGYGGLIDGNGVIWSGNSGNPGLLRWDPNAPDSPGVNPRCIAIPSYGLTIDPAGWVWTTDLFTGVYKVSPDGNTILGPFLHGMNRSQGLAADRNGDIWLSSSLFCFANCPISHLKNDGSLVGLVANPSGAGSTGVSVDAAGKVWTTNLNANTATRIDPTAGAIGGDGVTRIGAVDLVLNFPAGPDGRPLPNPYNYSDMTGSQLLSSVQSGSWTVVQDGGAGATWGTITWNTEPQGSVPTGASIVVEARAAATQAGLGAASYIPIANGVPFNLTGRFIQVRSVLTAGLGGQSPILSDLRIQAKMGDIDPPFCALTNKGRNSSGFDFIEVTVRDQQSGLASIQVLKAKNSNVVVPAFTPGTTSNVVITATKINQSLSSQVELDVFDVAGKSTRCDPVEVTLSADSRWGNLKILNGIPQAEGQVTIRNGTPGLNSVSIVVNGTRFESGELSESQLVTVNVSSAMKAGDDNTIVLRAAGARGATADVLIWDGVLDSAAPDLGGRLSISQ